MEDDAGDVENQYYKAKGLYDPTTKLNLPGLKEDNAEGALKAFRAIVDEQGDMGEW